MSNKKEHILYFLCGLNAEIFHFNPKFVLEEDEYFYLSFKLERAKNNV